MTWWPSTPPSRISVSSTPTGLLHAETARRRETHRHDRSRAGPTAHPFSVPETDNPAEHPVMARPERSRSHADRRAERLECARLRSPGSVTLHEARFADPADPGRLGLADRRIKRRRWRAQIVQL